MGSTSRAWRGVSSALANCCWPLGGWWLGGLHKLSAPARSEHGLAIVLPGVEGRSPLNWSIAQGLNDGGFAGRIQIYDWTTGFWPFFPYHLRYTGRNRRQAAAIAQIFVAYQDEHPGCPTYLVGHSGGAALSAWMLEALPPGRTITAATMLGPALPTDYPLAGALAHIEQALWHFWTPLDVFLLGIGTLACGNLDGRHAPSAGWVGFRAPRAAPAADLALYESRLRQCCFHPRMFRRFHLGGHMGWANRTFVAETVVPKLLNT